MLFAIYIPIRFLSPWENYAIRYQHLRFVEPVFTEVESYLAGTITLISVDSIRLAFFFFLNSTWIFVITAIFDSSLCNTFCYSVFYKTTDWWENNWYQILGFVDSMICLILLFELDWFTSLPVMHKISKLFLLLNRIKPRSPTSWLALFSVFWTI